MHVVSCGRSPMRAIMIVKSRFDTRVNIQYAATMLFARFPFFWCASTSNTLNTMFTSEHTRQHTWMCAFPVTMHFLHSCTPNLTPTHSNALQRCFPCPSSLFFFSKVSLLVLIPLCLIGQPSSSTLVAKNSSIPLTSKGVSRRKMHYLLQWDEATCKGTMSNLASKPLMRSGRPPRPGPTTRSVQARDKQPWRAH